jgi:hypothetical protein
MSQRLAFAWEVAQITPRADGLAFRCRYVGTTLPARHSYVLPRSHRAFREASDLLREAVTRGLVVEVTTTEDEPDEEGALTVTSVSLNGREARS